MKIIVTFYMPDDGSYKVVPYPSIKDAALSLGRAPRLLSHKMKHGGKDIETSRGTIISIEAIDGKTDNITSTIREHTDQPKENFPVGLVEICRSWGGFKQALGQIAAAIKRYISKFYKP